MSTLTVNTNTLGPIINGELILSGESRSIQSPYDQAPVSEIYQASADQVEQAISLATEAFEVTRKIASFERHRVLTTTAKLIARDKEIIAQGITNESGKPITAARAEVDRSVYTFEVAAEESRRIGGEIVALDWLPGNDKREAQVIRVPRGPVAGISPFNFPINLVAHKMAPSVAAGNPILIRPASQTAATAIRLGMLLIEAGWPKEAIAILPCSTAAAQALITDDRIKLLTFTGSPQVGWSLKSLAGRKPVTLELGGNAGNIVCQDTDVDYAVARVAWGGFVNAGQACISVQRVYVEQAIYDTFKEKLLARVSLLKTGDPSFDDTDVGPVIDRSSADRIEASIKAAEQAGAKVLAGGQRHGLVIEPTVIESSDESLDVAQSEIFGPVIVISPFTSFSEAVQKVNASLYGLQAGLFTRDLGKIREAIDQIDVGGIMVNDVSTFRIDHMPYGGVKGSGSGREGLKYAIEEMTEMKLITYNHSIY
jgi:acyl-CoA reductase-like NAD-dependent aldehyde dehydrogenase